MENHRSDPNVSIIMPVGRTKLLFLKTMIERLLERTCYPNWHLIVIDDNNPADIREYLRGLENITLISNDTPKTFAANCNRAIKLRKAGFYLLFNSDVYVLDRDWLTKMVNIARRNPQCGIVGASVNGCGSFWYITSSGHASPYHYYHRKYLVKGPFEAQVVGGFNFMISDEVVQKIGYLDEGFTPVYGEEAEYCIRAVARGFRVFDSYAGVYHIHRGGYQTVNNRMRVAEGAMRRISLRWSYLLSAGPLASYPKAVRFLDFQRRIGPLMPESREAIPVTSQAMVVDPLYEFFPEECVRYRFMKLDRIRTDLLILAGLVVKRLIQAYYEFRFRNLFRMR